MIGDVFGPGLRGEGEHRFVDLEVKADLAPCRQPVDFVLAEVAQPRSHQRRLPQRGIGGRCRVKGAVSSTKPHTHRDPARFGVVGPDQRLDPVGEIDLFNLQRANRLLLRDGAGCADGREFIEGNGLRGQPCAAIDHSFARQGQSQAIRVRFSGGGCDIDRAGDTAFKQRLGARQHFSRVQPRGHAVEHRQHHIRRGHGFTDVYRVDEIIGKVGARLDAFLFDPIGKGHREFRRLTVDFLLRRRIGERIGDDIADIAQRRLPIISQRGKGDKGCIG